MTQSSLNGILCVDKPQDFTSFDVVAKLRGITRQKKIGHAGTLDPMATGVLPVFFGAATKACDLLPQDDKRYRVSFRFGLSTDTQDIWGKPLTTSDAPVSRAQLEAALEGFRGALLQLPPMYSAVSVNGQRLYDLARQGIQVERQPRPITVHQLTLLDYDETARSGEAEVHCSKGTYIRTLCHDIGQQLGAGGVMTGLRRMEAAGFGQGDCLTLPEIAALAGEGKLAQRLLPVERLFQVHPPCRLNPVQTRMFLNGVRLDLNRLADRPPAGRCRVYGSDGAFLGLADCDPQRAELRLKKFFVERS